VVCDEHGIEFWEVVCDEHGIGGNGEYSVDNDVQFGRVNVFFQEVSDGK
jgi:tubulin beta